MEMLFIPGLFIVAYMYSSVGHGGASSYLALMAFYNVAPEFMKSSSLILNLFVSLIAFITFFRSGVFRLHLLLPFIITSIPLSFLGAGLIISPVIYRKVLALCLLIATIKILLPSRNNPVKTSILNIPVALIAGGVIGFLSGMIGIGGGIMLSPLLLLTNWATIKESAGITSAFTFLNSAAGLTGLYSSHSLHIVPDLFLWTIIVLTGGLIGSYFGAFKYTGNWMKYPLSLVLVLASVKLFIQ